jgi:hypothetical protein
MEWEKEDRDIEKQLLQHRLRELKIAEKVQARQLAAQNFEFMSGISEKDVPESAREMRPYQEDPEALASVPGSIPSGSFESTGIKEMELPGVEEFGIPPVRRRPQTMEEQLANQLIQLRQKALVTPQRLSQGMVATLPLTGEVLGRGEPRTFAPRAPVRSTQRDAQGNEQDVFLDPATGEQVFSGSTRAPRPQRPSTVVRLGDEGRSQIVAGIMEGSIPPVLGTSAQDRLIAADLRKAGFNLSEARLEYDTLRAKMRSMETGSRAALADAADRAELALTELENISAKWDSSGIAPGATLAWYKRFGGAQEKALAAQYEAAIASAQTAIATVAAAGRQPTNKALEDAAKVLSAGSHEKTKATIAQLKKTLPKRTSAIRAAVADSVVDPVELQPGTGTGAGTGAGGGGGATQPPAQPSAGPSDADIAAALTSKGYDSSPASVAKVKGNREAMRFLGFEVK